MKNVFKFLGIAFVACSMLVACGEDTETFTIKVKANDSSMGTVTGGGKYESGATATLEATANAGYTFVEWEDGSKNNPRLVTVTADAEYTANFAAQAGVKVTFGDNTWNAGYVNGLYYGDAIVLAAAQTNAQSLPQFALQLYDANGANLATGTFTGAPEFTAQGVNVGNPYLWYYETQNGVTLNYTDGSSVNAGDWWAKNLTLNITALDADALTMSCVANTTMFNVYQIAAGTASSIDDCATKSLTLNVANQGLTQGSKGVIIRNQIAKIK